jgi:post-segregation antitoxin (ccd killing protein)
MTDLARWSIKVSRETDVALRTLLASRGGRKGDLSRFVEEAVNREVLRATVREVQARNADADPAEIQQLVDDELEDIRGSFWADRRQ